MHVVVTGANGFVGSALCKQLAAQGSPYTAFVRKKNKDEPHQTIVENYFNFNELVKAIPSNTTTLIHLAARVHQPKQSEIELYTRENVDLTRIVIEAAAKASVPHVILMSTMKVYGEFCDEDFTVDSPCHPVSDYGKTKLKAEEIAKELCKKNNMHLDIVRIPLVVGEKAKGNLGAVAKLLAWGLPLPFAGIRNRRSFLRLDTLVDRLIKLSTSTERKKDFAELWVHIVAEPEPVSTSQLIAIFAHQRHVKLKFFKVPNCVLRSFCFALDVFRGNRSSRQLYVKSEEKILGNSVLIPGSKLVDPS